MTWQCCPSSFQLFSFLNHFAVFFWHYKVIIKIFFWVENPSIYSTFSSQFLYCHLAYSLLRLIISFFLLSGQSDYIIRHANKCRKLICIPRVTNIDSLMWEFLRNCLEKYWERQLWQTYFYTDQYTRNRISIICEDQKFRQCHELNILTEIWITIQIVIFSIWIWHFSCSKNKRENHVMVLQPLITIKNKKHCWQFLLHK